MAITPPGAGTFTAIHFVMIALLVIATLAVLVAGIRRSRARRAADAQVEAEAQASGLPVATVDVAPAELRDAPLAAQALDRSAFDPAPAPPADDDLASPRPIAPRPLADRPVTAAVPTEASPATTDAPASVHVYTSSPADDSVTQLKGLGPKVATRLAELGITSVGQVAALDADQAQTVDAQLGPFAGRLHRDRWVEQARFLAAGDRAGFEAVFGKL